jgi:hypothetical protein
MLFPPGVSLKHQGGGGWAARRIRNLLEPFLILSLDFVGHPGKDKRKTQRVPITGSDLSGGGW